MTMIILSIALILCGLAINNLVKHQDMLEIKVEALQKLVLGLLKQSEGK